MSRTEMQDPNAAPDARAGRILNDFLDRKARGEPVSEAETIAAHPDLADVLREHFEMLAGLQPPGRKIKELIAQGVLAASADADFAAELGPYKIRAFIGRGGMGIVLEAYEERLDRTVALKILRPDLADDATAVRRFTREAKAAAALRNPNIVTVHAVGEERGVHYLAMEYVEGPSLADVVRRQGPRSSEVIQRLFRDLLCGLSAAHEVGLIHRDIKSSNILLDGWPIRASHVSNSN